MTVLEIILISFGLAMDAFAMAVCKGLSMNKMNWKNAMIVGLYFGLFQAGMPLIGYILGNSFESLVVSIDHWIAFVLLSFIGGKMIKDIFNKDDVIVNDNVGIKNMIILAIATSIDALAVGITFSCLQVNILFACTCIGIITFTLSVIGVKIGNRFGNKFENKARFLGGLILIFLGIDILAEHLNLF